MIGVSSGGVRRRLRLPGGGSFFLSIMLMLFLVACDSVEERVAGHYERGERLLEEGAPDKAILEFSNALQLDSEHVPSLFAIAGILEKRGDLKGAFARYAKVAELDPTHAAARLKLARFQVLGNAMEKASEELAASLEHAPDEADAHALAAIIALRKGDDAAAGAALETAKALAPMNVEVLQAEIAYLRKTAGTAQAIALADEAIAAHPEMLSFYALKLKMLEEQDDQPGIGAHLAVMIETFPNEPSFRQARAKWALRNDDLAAAEAELRAIVAAMPENREAVFTLIRFLLRQYGRETARSELTRMIESSEEAFPLELMLAQFDIQTGQAKATIAYLRELIERAGENANEPRLMLAQLLVREGKSDEAWTLIDMILEEDPQNVEALVLKTAQLVGAEQLDPALQAVRRGLTEAPDDIRLLLMAGRIHELLGNLNLASDRYAKAVRASQYYPANVERYVEFLTRTNRPDAAMTMLTEAVARRPGEARLLDLLASLKLRKRDWAGAEMTIATLEKQDPERAKQLRGVLMMGQERFDEGEGLLRNLPEEESSRAASIVTLIEAYMRQGEVDKVRTLLDDLIEKDPKNVQVIGLRGNLRFAEGDRAAARAAYEEILQIDPANPGAYSALARLAEAEDDRAGAMQILERGLEASNNNPLLLSRLAVFKEVEGDIDAAIELYDQLYKRLPDSLLAVNNLASLLADHRSEDPASVDRAYRIAGRLRNATLPHYRDTYGWTRYLKGEYQEALEYLLDALAGLPDSPWVHFHVGMTQAALDNTVEARAYLEKALELAGEQDFAPATRIRATLATLE